tara:strand:- start:27 stop:194 length:168 start_codon:yes stop_codon:yes gene_type:complete
MLKLQKRLDFINIEISQANNQKTDSTFTVHYKNNLLDELEAYKNEILEKLENKEY